MLAGFCGIRNLGHAKSFLILRQTSLISCEMPSGLTALASLGRFLLQPFYLHKGVITHADTSCKKVQAIRDITLRSTLAFYPVRKHLIMSLVSNGGQHINTTIKLTVIFYWFTYFYHSLFQKNIKCFINTYS